MLSLYGVSMAGYWGHLIRDFTPVLGSNNVGGSNWALTTVARGVILILRILEKQISVEKQVRHQQNKE